jgi:lysophospholipase L1-like esterase
VQSSRSWTGRIVAVARIGWLVIGIWLVLLLVLELASSVVVRVVEGRRAAAEDRTQADIYRDAPWARETVDEAAAAHINVDADGVRRTWQPPMPAGARPCFRVFAFGGSTMWCAGARDEHTIASQLARHLTDRLGCPVEVTNYGETGWVTNQEMILLLQELRRGNVPDLAVFYDGFNDTFSAFQNGRAGVPQNEWNRVEEFNLLNASRRGDLRRAFIRSFTSETATGRIAGYLMRKLIGAKGDKGRRAEALASEHQRELAAAVVRDYTATIQVITRLGREWGFDTIFFWQPVIFGKPQLTAYEQRCADEIAYLKPFLKQTYDDVRQSKTLNAMPNFVNLSDVLTDVTEPLYFDPTHFGEAGNDLVARRMTHEIVPLLEARRRTSAERHN